MHNKILLFAISLILSSCIKESGLYNAKDLVYVGEFSRGLEGPAVDLDGNLYFVNPIKNGTIGLIDSENKFSLFIDSLPNGSVANGIRFDSSDLMYLADYAKHNILSINIKTKEINVVAHDSLINQPNDIAISKNNILFASDPNWKNSTGNLLKIEGNKIIVLEKNMGTTNGIEISPAEDKLYVNESVQRNIWVYDLDSNMNISNKKLFYKFDDFGLDGMRCDIKGNLYVTRHGKGTVIVFSPDGKIINEIQLKGKKPSNIAFGGPDGKTAYITLQDRGYIETFRIEHSGRAFSMNSQ
jgi:gluconolactonase